MVAKLPQGFVPNELADQWVINKAREDFWWFVYFVSGFTKELMPIHKEWFDAINDDENQYINISTFPGCGKTTLIQYWIAWKIGREPYLTFMLLSASEEQASSRLMAIKAMIEHDDNYKAVFPHVHKDTRRKNDSLMLNVWSEKWRYNSKEKLSYSTWRTLLGRFGEMKDATLAAFGITSNRVLGTRITGAIVLDDVQDAKNSMTEEQRFKLFSIFQKDVRTRLTVSKVAPFPKIVSINNRQHPNDLAGRLSELKRADGSSVWKSIETPIIDEEGNSNFPELFPPERIESLKEESGGADSFVWKMVYLVKATAASSGEFKLDDLRQPLPNPLPELNQIVITVDFAHTISASSDYTVFTAIAKDDKKPFNVYVLDSVRFKSESVSVKIDRLVDFYNTIQTVYGPVRRIVFEDRDSAPERQYLNSLRPEIPTDAVKIKQTNKDGRLKEFAGYVQSGKVFFNTSMPTYPAMVGELIDFPSGKHDDICDTLSLVWLLPDWVNMFGQSGIVYIEEKRQEDKRRIGVI